MQRQELLDELTEVRLAATRLAAICHAGRAEDAECPKECPGLTACSLEPGTWRVAHVAEVSEAVLQTSHV